MADHDDLIQQFTNVTGADASRARFFLESSNWDAQLAITTFFEHGDSDEMEMPHLAAEEEEPAALPPGRFNPGPPSGSKSNKPSGSSNSKFATLSSVRGNEEDSSSEEEGQAFYAGGSDRSGQQVLGPPRKKNPADDLFKSAREHGAQPVDAGAPPAKRGSAFRGTGYRLGETEDQSDVVQGLPVKGRQKQVDMVLKLWKNGFSVDNGELRDFNDPANREFLDAISRGEVPHELIRLGRGGEVSLNMEDHRNEEYARPKASAVKIFSGAGHMLGSPAPSVVSSASTATSGSGSNSQGSASSVTVDDSQPTTSIQIRLADGTRLVLKLNHTHTVQDIRKYIIEQRSQYASTEFVLMTTFPNKELSNEELTLKDAQLLNAVIVQKLK